MTGDVGHRVITDPIVHAVVEDAHDVGMVQPRRRARLGAEPPLVLLAIAELRVHDLECNRVAQRLTHGLVNHAHSACAQVADDAVVAKLVWQRAGPHRRKCPGSRRPRIGLERFALLDGSDFREQIADFVGELRVVRDVIGDRGVLAAPQPLGEVFGQAFKGVSLCR